MSPSSYLAPSQALEPPVGNLWFVFSEPQFTVCNGEEFTIVQEPLDLLIPFLKITDLWSIL